MEITLEPISKIKEHTMNQAWTAEVMANIKGETISLDEKIKKSGFRELINQELWAIFS